MFVSVLPMVALITLTKPQLYKSCLILAKLLSPVTLLLSLLAMLVPASTVGVAPVQSAITKQAICFDHHMEILDNLTRILEVNTCLSAGLHVPVVVGLVGCL